MSSTVLSDLSSQLPAIASILQASGTPGLSVGVFDRGRTIFTHHFSNNTDSEALNADPNKLNDDTLYYIASLSKLLTVCALARLVTDGVLDWDAPIRNYLPTFRE